MCNRNMARNPLCPSPSRSECALFDLLITNPLSGSCPRAGDVPNLMGPDDLEQITSAMKPLMAAAGVPAVDKNSIYAYFVDR